MTTRQKLTLHVLGIATLLILACGLGAPATTFPEAPTFLETQVAGTMQALTAAAPPATEIPATDPPGPHGIPVSFQNVSFVIPEGLALGAAGEIIPASLEETGAPWEVGPEHIRFSFSGYDNSLGKFSNVEIRVNPVLDDAGNEWMGNSLNDLRAILASPNAPIAPRDMPKVPYFNAGQMFASQIKLVNFQGGSGVRAVTQYGQAVGPVNNNGTFYLFVGLTSDGKHYITVVLPIGASFLPDDYDSTQPAPPNAIPFPDYATASEAEFEAYYQAVTDQINAAAPEDFTPNLSQLDALVQSITIIP